MEAHHRDLVGEAVQAVAYQPAPGTPANLAESLAGALAERGLAIVDANAAEFAKTVNEQAARPDIVVLWVVLPVTRDLLVDAAAGPEVVANMVAKEAHAQVLKRIEEAR